MGLMKHVIEEKARKVGKKQAIKANGFSYTSFYPTKEEKAQIKGLTMSWEEVADQLSSLVQSGLKVVVRSDTQKDCYTLVIMQDVPFGSTCNALSFWHSDLAMCFQQMMFLAGAKLDHWIETGSLSGEFQQVDW